MNAYSYRMPAGIVGALSRAAGQAVVEPQVLGAQFAAYGKFGKIVNEKFVPIAAADAAGVVYGLLVRPFPTNSGTDGLGAATPPAGGVGDVLRRGYASVKLDKGVAAKNGQVYVRIAVNGGDVVGQIEAALVANETVAVANCVFTGPADANGITEIEFRV